MRPCSMEASMKVHDYDPGGLMRVAYNYNALCFRYASFRFCDYAACRRETINGSVFQVCQKAFPC